MDRKLIALIIFCLTVFELHAAELKILTESMPPYNYEDEKSHKAAGFTVEIVKALLERTGIKAAGGEMRGGSSTCA